VALGLWGQFGSEASFSLGRVHRAFICPERYIHPYKRQHPSRSAFTINQRVGGRYDKCGAIIASLIFRCKFCETRFCSLAYNVRTLLSKRTWISCRHSLTRKVRDDNDHRGASSTRIPLSLSNSQVLIVLDILNGMPVYRYRACGKVKRADECEIPGITNRADTADLHCSHCLQGGAQAIADGKPESCRSRTHTKQSSSKMNAYRITRVQVTPTISIRCDTRVTGKEKRMKRLQKTYHGNYSSFRNSLIKSSPKSNSTGFLVTLWWQHLAHGLPMQTLFPTSPSCCLR
jgi:hypothetical protein